MQISTLIGTQVFSPQGDTLGYVKEVFPARGYRALSSLLCVDGEEEEFVLPARAVLAVKDAVIASRARIAKPTGIPSPLGRAAFSAAGEFLGTVCELTLGEEPSVEISDGTKTVKAPCACAVMGGTVIVYDTAKKRPQRKNCPERREEPARCDLIGRQVRRTVYDAFGVPIARAGEKVTPAMLALARRRNRLIALAVNTLTVLP